jgi:hypothetical protein
MDDPELGSDEKVLARAHAVHVKSISFEAVLTSKRIILVDRIKNLLPPKEILLATLKDVEPGENAIRDQIITLTIFTKTSDIRQMVLTFSREGGGNRKKERDEWIRLIKDNLTPTLEQVIRKVIPGFEPLPKAPGNVAAPKIEVVGSPVAPAPSLGTYCTRCGNRVPDGSEFCNYCGTQITIPGEVPPAPIPQTPDVAIKKERPIDREIQSVEPLIQKSMEKIPKDPLRAVPAEPAARPAAPPPQETPAPPMPVWPTLSSESPSPAAPAKSAGRRFIPRLFSPKELHPTPLIPESMPTAVPQEPRQPKSKKKVVIAAGIIVITLVIVAAAVLILPKSGGGGASAPGTGPASTPVTGGANSAQTASTSGAVVVAQTTAVTIPQTGVWIHVNYIGGWKGTYGMPDAQQQVTRSGNHIYEVENATGTVTASFGKLDGSSHNITVEIYNDGTLLTQGVTAAAFGTVTLSADTTTGIAQAPVIGGGTGTTAAPATTTPGSNMSATATIAKVTNTT